MRMLAGVLAGHAFSTTMTGDESLQRRPMRRVIVPLERMGARIASVDGRPPITIDGTSSIQPMTYQPEVPSAQVKTAVLFAGLHGEGVTGVVEPLATRDHTERALRAFGVRVDVDGRTVSLRGRQRLAGCALEVPGDISSAAFWMCAGAALPGSEVLLEGVGLNPSRSAIVDVLRRMGADLTIDAGQPTDGEPMGQIIARHGGHQTTEIRPEEVPGVIDELPVLAALATHCGDLRVTGAAELRVKESDRISALADGIQRMGGEIEEYPDGFHDHGARRLTGGDVDARHDHRLAMAFAIAALGASGPSTIHDAAAAAVSYPEFFRVLVSLRG
jgi:3-phosphoshikimate 1-carboxyvinyltransferase